MSWYLEILGTTFREIAFGHISVLWIIRGNGDRYAAFWIPEFLVWLDGIILFLW